MSATPLSSLTRTFDPQSALRRLLALDAAVTGVNALAYLFLSGPLGRFLGVGSGLLTGLGALLAAYAVAVGLAASRRHPPTLGVRAVVEANLAWAAVSCAALVLWLEPSAAGAVWTVLQALVVAGFALLQHMALRSRQLSQD
ncbi:MULTISPECIES: hypothetical protein [unclassified Streptomyces]|uniref:hypothetical protein n=1 Tax=unclassified Streptomyces TaxID=2593676 RepID=UPI0007ECCFCF|nr:MULTISPECIES: hypothetical protein [unclassified Streptomyces]MCP3767584.1 hypothetical protein [Streptomyces sp. MAR25Y5]OBQ53487.1 hypothetical protein A4U61_04715 [Streptomyces sp. H-KF8]